MRDNTVIPSAYTLSKVYEHLSLLVIIKVVDEILLWSYVFLIMPMILSFLIFFCRPSSNDCIIESVDSISRDGPDTPIYIIHYKKRNNSEQENFKTF